MRLCEPDGVISQQREATVHCGVSKEERGY